jgi:hypothetical protein
MVIEGDAREVTAAEVKAYFVCTNPFAGVDAVNDMPIASQALDVEVNVQLDDVPEAI